jgi:hypothetical protein
MLGNVGLLGQGIKAGREFLRKFIEDAVLDQEAVGRHTGLPGVAEASDGAFHGRVQVRVLEHDGWRVAAEFQEGSHHAFGSHGHDLLAYARGTCEGVHGEEHAGGAGVVGKVVGDCVGVADFATAPGEAWMVCGAAA